MKKFTIITGLSLVFIVLITSITCTYFDPSAASGNKPSLFWIGMDGRIFRAPLEEPRNYHEVFHSMAGMPTCIRVDPLEGYIYWGLDDMGTTSIQRVRFDGSDQETLINTENSVNSIAIDPKEKMIYFAEGSLILRGPLNKADPPVVIFENPNMMIITDITLDFTENRLIIADASPGYRWIDMYEPDAYDGGDSLDVGAEKIVFDKFSECIYYLHLAGGTDYIYREDLPTGGSTAQIVFFLDNIAILDFAVDRKDGFVYCAEQNAVHKVPVDGGPGEIIIDNMDIQRFTIDFIQ